MIHIVGTLKLASSTGTLIQPVVIGPHELYANQNYLPISVLSEFLL